MSGPVRSVVRSALGRNPYGARKGMGGVVRALAQYAVATAELAAVLWLPGYAARARRAYARPISVMVIGAQKAGTTWLHDRVEALGLAATSREKECHQFDLGRCWTVARHARRFSAAGPVAPAVEFAPDYGPLALWRLRALHRLFPDLRVVLVMRDPARRAWSATKMETGFVTGRAVSRVPVQDLVAYLVSPRCRARSDYAAMLRRWASVLGRERVHVLLYEDLAHDPAGFLVRAATVILGRAPEADMQGRIAAAAERGRVFPGDREAPPAAALRVLLRDYAPMAEAALAPGVPGVDRAMRERARAAWGRSDWPAARRGRALYVSGFVPNPAATSAGQRLAYGEYARLRALHERVDVIAFVNALDGLDPPPPDDLFAAPPTLVRLTAAHRLRAAVLRPDLPLFASVRGHAGKGTVDGLLERHAYTDIHADFSQGLAALPPRLWPAVDFRQHDIVSRLYRRRAAGGGLRGLFYALEARRAERWEAGAWHAVSAIRTLALDDPAEIRARVPGAVVTAEPPGPTLAGGASGPSRRPVPGRIVFWGNMARAENVDAARIAAREVLPRLRERRPAAHLRIVGAHPGPEVRSLAGAHVTVTGFVEDPLAEFARAEAALAPLRHGSGVKLKVVETLAAGLPTVATPVGAEGIAPSDLLIVREGAADLASALAELLSPGAPLATSALPRAAS